VDLVCCVKCRRMCSVLLLVTEAVHSMLLLPCIFFETFLQTFLWLTPWGSFGRPNDFLRKLALSGNLWQDLLRSNVDPFWLSDVDPFWLSVATSVSRLSESCHYPPYPVSSDSPTETALFRSKPNPLSSPVCDDIAFLVIPIKTDRLQDDVITFRRWRILDKKW